MAMFVCAISANVLYGAGILFRTYRWSDIASSAPWLLGSLGTVFLDLIIYSQVPISLMRLVCYLPQFFSAQSSAAGGVHFDFRRA